MTLPSDLPQLADFASKTPLTTLIFDECELIPQSLGRILATPKSLKHLVLGENVCNNRDSRSVNPRLSRAPDAALKALLHVSHSLETLVHLDPHYATLPDPSNPPALRLKGSGMRDFHRLAFIECDRCSFLHQGIIANRELAPPGLKTLRIHQSGRGHRSRGNVWHVLPDHTPYVNLPSLKLLEFTTPTTSRTSLYHVTEHVALPDRMRERHSWAFKLWTRGIGVKMYVEVHKHFNLIPPYLHGEVKPELVLLYDSFKVGFERRLPFPEDQRDDPLLSPDEPEKQRTLTVTDRLSDADISTLSNGAYRALRRHKLYIDSLNLPGSGDRITFTELMLELMPELESDGEDLEEEDFIGEVEDDGDEAWEDEDSEDTMDSDISYMSSDEAFQAFLDMHENDHIDIDSDSGDELLDGLVN